MIGINDLPVQGAHRELTALDRLHGEFHAIDIEMLGAQHVNFEFGHVAGVNISELNDSIAVRDARNNELLAADRAGDDALTALDRILAPAMPDDDR